MKSGAILKIKKLTAANYRQVLIVFLAFLTMVLVSYFYVSHIVRQQIQVIGGEALDTTQMSLSTCLYEAELLHENVVYNISDKLVSGESNQEIWQYLKTMYHYYGAERLLPDFLKVYAYIRGEFLDGSEWIPSDDYIPTLRPWYIGAVESGGEVYTTEPYIDFETNAMCITISQQLFDSEGNSYGIVAVDVRLVRITDYITEREVTNNGYAVLLDSDMRFISHRNDLLTGIAMENAGGEYDALAHMMMKESHISAEHFKDADGVDSVAFFRPIFNGWNIGFIVPEASLYKPVYNMGIILGGLGFILMLGLSYMLVRIHSVQMRAAEELVDTSASLKILEAVLNGLDIFLYVTDSETDKILFVNRALMDHFGLSDSVIGEYCWRVFQAGFDKRCNYCSLNKLLDNPDESVLWEAQNTITGRYYRNIDRMIDWPDGKKVHFCQRIDMTETKKAQETLLRMSSIVENSPNFISYRKITGECVFVNRAASELTGFSGDELMGDYISNIYDRETADHIRSVILPEILEKGMVNYELPYRRKDGSLRYCSVTSFKIESDENAIASIAMDSTDKKRAETERMEALEKAEQANRAKSDFLSRMSHEMRTPMNAIIGMAALAQRTDDRVEVQECLKTISGSADHLLGIINDILIMSKIEAGKMKLSETDFHIQDVLDQINTVMHSKFREKRQSFTATVVEDVPKSIIADKRKVTQIIINLLNNANKFTQECGTIELSICKTKHIGNRCELLIRVKDNGIGIPEEQHKRLFDAFEQADNTITRQYGGTGLGLSITKNIVNMMNGEIWVNSEPGQGSVFSFTINVGVNALGINNEQEEKFSNTDDVVNIFSGKRILLADDVEINREILIALLDETGVTIDYAENGKEVCDKFAADPGIYNMIFMDIHMPEMDGYEATGCIREMKVPEAGTVPIIAMTADVFSEDVQKCLAAGMNDHVGKPLDMETVIAKMKLYLL